MIYDCVIIGAGPAGLAAAVSAKKNGLEKILVLERDTRPGGILLQCIHNGFGLHYFGEELTGPEYALRFVKQAEEAGIEIKTDTMVLEIIKGEKNHRVTAINSAEGLLNLETRSVIVSTGCRERTRGALLIPGTRPAGIFTAGSAQRFLNIDGYLPGKKVVILGSGDIGLIMARRLTLEGAEVKMVLEIMNYSAGLARNITQCLENFNIPLKTRTTIVQIHGNERVTGVTIAKVDEHRKPVPETFEYVECDTVLLSVGLIPENELLTPLGVNLDTVTSGPVVNQRMETSVPGIFACGNSVHVHDLVDFVTEESILAGKAASEYVLSGSEKTLSIPVVRGNRVRYVVPQKLEVPDLAEPSTVQKEDFKACFKDGSSGKEDDTVRIMYRSTEVYKSVSVTACIGQKELKREKKRIVRPGEMQIIEIPARALKEVKDPSVPLTISIELPEDLID